MSNQMSWFEDNDQEFKDLPEGIYTGKLTNATLDEKKPDDPRISVEFTLVNKRKVWLNLKFGETAKKFSSWMFRELGVYDRAKEMVAGGKPLTHAFLDALGEIIGKCFDLEIGYREYNGKRYQNVKVECESTGTAMNGPPAADPNEPKFDEKEELPF